MRTKFPRLYRIYLFKGPELNNGYIGSHMNDAVTGKWKIYNGSSKILKALIEEYGRSRFIKYLLDELSFESRFEKDKIESFYIHKYNTLAPNGVNRYDPGVRLGFNNTGNKGYSHSKEGRKNHSKAAIKKWSDPAFREKHWEVMHSSEVKEKWRRARNTSEFKENQSRRMKEIHNNSEYKEKQRILRSTLEFKEKMSISQKEAHNRPEVQEKIRITCNTPEYKEMQRNKAIDQWKDSKIREKMIASHKTCIRNENGQFVKPKMKRTT